MSSSSRELCASLGFKSESSSWWEKEGEQRDYFAAQATEPQVRTFSGIRTSMLYGIVSF